MSNKKPALWIWPSLGALLISVVGVRLLDGNEPQPSLSPETEPAIDSADVAGERERAAERVVDPSGSLRRDLIARSDEGRNHVLWLAIRDAGFECDEIRHAGMSGPEAMGWVASCAGGVSYFVRIDDTERVSVSEVPSGDFHGVAFPRIEVPAEATDIPPIDLNR